MSSNIQDKKDKIDNKDKKDKIVAIDLDGVVFDSIGFCDEYVKRHRIKNDALNRSNVDWVDMNYVYIFSPVIAGAKEFIDNLHEKGYKIAIMTARHNSSIELLTEDYTKRYLEYCGIYYDDIYFCGSNSKADKMLEIGAKILIDDTYEHIADCKDKGLYSIHFNCNDVTWGYIMSIIDKIDWN